jgi:hypothetical protein
MLQIRETFVNATKGYRFRETEWYEPFTQDRGELYRSLQKEYGAAKRMYVDRPEPWDLSAVGQPRSRTEACGWVFSSRELYEDASDKRPEDYYTREVWVDVRDVPEES